MQLNIVKAQKSFFLFHLKTQANKKHDWLGYDNLNKERDLSSLFGKCALTV